jgi:hypothetical protein
MVKIHRSRPPEEIFRPGMELARLLLVKVTYSEGSLPERYLEKDSCPKADRHAMWAAGYSVKPSPR